MAPREGTVCAYSIAVDYFLTRARDKGRLLPKRVRQSSEARGSVQISEQRNEVRRRVMLVAHFNPTDGKSPVPPLYDVRLLGMFGGAWALAGFESLPIGPMGDECSVAQTWFLQPGPYRALEHADNQWRKLAIEIHELRKRMGNPEALKDEADLP